MIELKIMDEAKVQDVLFLLKIGTEETCPGEVFDPMLFINMADVLMEGRNFVMVAYKDGDPIGAIGFVEENNAMYKTNRAAGIHFFVLKEHRDSLIGLALIKKSETKAKELGYKEITVSMPNDREQSLQAIGFSPSNRVFKKEI